MNRLPASTEFGPGPAEYLFGSFRLTRQGQTLYRDERIVKLGGRARHILSILVERAGEIIDKREILDLVWPDTTVLEANLTVHIAALRQALGDSRDGGGFIINVPGRGYRFVAGVIPIAGAAPIRDLDGPAPG